MINLTYIALTVTSLYTHSPSFVGNRIAVRESSFSKFTSTLFFNQDSLFFNANKFQTGLGNVIYAHSDELSVKAADNQQININEITEAMIVDDRYSNYSVYAIFNCIIKKIKGADNGVLKFQDSKKFLYMTDCVFIDCSGKKYVIHPLCKATTFSHICSYNSTSNDGEQDSAEFAYCKIARGTFFVFMFSTIAGDGEKNGNDKCSIIQMDGGKQHYSCLNISNYDLTNSINSNGLIKIVSSQCVTMKLCTFEKSTCYHICYNRNGEATYFENNYYYDLKIKNQLFYFSGKDVDVYYCIFNKISFASHKDIVFCDDVKCNFFQCVFKNSDYNIAYSTYFQYYPSIHISNIFTDDPQQNVNNHFVTDNYCPGIKADKAYGCAVGDCPPDKGCGNATIEYGKGDVEYTTIPHGDMQSTFFTQSDIFTISEGFSNSKDFTFSSHFSQSDDFEETNPFSKSYQFSNSAKFSNSNYFSNSKLFSESEDFSESSDFLESSDFSESSVFSISTGFSLSVQFSQSKEFTISEKFTISENFEKSNEFTLSNKFEQSKDFSSSDGFKMTKQFSDSNLFTYSLDFTISEEFPVSSAFTGSNTRTIFTPSKGFTQTKFFSESGLFSKSAFFEETELFTKSNGFVQTKFFSDSGLFSKSAFFEETELFTESNGFMNTKGFSESVTLEEIIKATSSFSQSNLLKKDIIIDNQDQNKKKLNWVGIGIGIVSGIILIAIIIIFVVFYQRKPKEITSDINLDDEETINPMTNTETSLTFLNHLDKMLDKSDPFSEDFEEVLNAPVNFVL